MSSSYAHPVDLEPSFIANRTYASRRRYTYVDSPKVLCLMVGLLYLLPAHLIVPNLTYAGRPALMVALLLWCWWLMTHLHPRLVMPGPQPLRWAVAGYLLALLLSYLAGLDRGLPTLEANGQDFTVITVCEFLGVVLMAADGIPNWERLNGVLRFFVWCASFMAFTGVVQSLFKFDLTRYLIVPGLSLKGDLAGFENRGEGGLFRVAGTATHYIEFSAVLAMAVPFAIHYARFSPTLRKRRIYRGLAVLLAGAIPVAISRTGIVALAAVMVVMVPAWGNRFRYNVLGAAIALTGTLVVVRPGVLGTLKSMLLNANSEDDPSVAGRTQDYAFVAHWFSERPWLGRGPGTLIPAAYNGMVLDNQWFGQLVTWGLIGVIALAVLHISCITLAGLAFRRAQRAEDRHLCVALISVQILAIVVAATFDSLGFSTFAFTLALLMGCCGAVWRFTHPARKIRTSTVRRAEV